MEKELEQFKKVAPVILANVKARLTGSESDGTKLAIIHEEIVAYFSGWQKFFEQYLCFNKQQHINFAELMYDLLVPQEQGSTLTTTATFTIPPARDYPLGSLSIDALPESVQVIAAQTLKEKLSRTDGMAKEPANKLAQEVRDAFIELHSPSAGVLTQHDNDQP